MPIVFVEQKNMNVFYVMLKEPVEALQLTEEGTLAEFT